MDYLEEFVQLVIGVHEMHLLGEALRLMRAP